MNQKPLTRFLNVDFFTCDNCQEEFKRDDAYSLARNLEQLEHFTTYCASCVKIVEQTPEFCSFNGMDDKTKQYVVCEKPLFDKKKQLCRSHNRQVRKRFDEFTKEMSVSSTAAWETTWEQSGDWRYWWNLSPQKTKDLPTAKLSNDKHELKKVSVNKKQKNWGVAPINETTENLQSLNLDKRSLKKTGRIHLFATRVKKEWIERLKATAYEERLHYNEVLEKALECYEKHRK